MRNLLYIFALVGLVACGNLNYIGESGTIIDGKDEISSELDKAQ